MMKKLFLIFPALVVIAACNYKKTPTTENYIAVPYKIGVESYFESLKGKHPDLLISFASECIGCFSDTNRTYFFWQEDGLNYAAKIQDSVLYETRKIGDIGKFEIYFDSIQHEKWTEPPLHISHYGYDDFTVDNKDYSINLKVIDYYKASNENTYRVKFVTALDSTVKSIKNSAWYKASNIKL